MPPNPERHASTVLSDELFQELRQILFADRTSE